ncbi:MAG: fluoride efflux transporter CrcB [Nocardioides sp.]
MPTPHDPHARHDPFPDLPVDPDVTPGVHGSVVAAVAVGGALGAAARWAVAEALPHTSGQLPWATLLTNVLGCFLIGVLMVVVLERLPRQRLVRPFLGTGILGGFTTFSTYVLDTRGLVAAHHTGLAAAYLAGSLVAGLLAVVAGLRLTEQVLR